MCCHAVYLFSWMLISYVSCDIIWPQKVVNLAPDGRFCILQPGGEMQCPSVLYVLLWAVSFTFGKKLLLLPVICPCGLALFGALQTSVGNTWLPSSIKVVGWMTILIVWLLTPQTLRGGRSDPTFHPSVTESYNCEWSIYLIKVFLKKIGISFRTRSLLFERKFCFVFCERRGQKIIAANVSFSNENPFAPFFYKNIHI